MLSTKKKRPGCLWFNTRVWGTFWEVECLTAFLHPRANAPRLAISLHLYHLGNFSPKKKDLFWFCCCLFAFTFYGRSFSLLNMLRTRNGYKHLLLGFCTTGGTLRTRGFDNILTLTHCVCASPLQYWVSPLLLLVRIYRLIPRTCPFFAFLFCLLEEMGIGDPSAWFLGPARRR
jgi:hypothetical protein